MADPLTDVQNAIWTALNASSAFVALVPTTMQENLYGEGAKFGAMGGFDKSAVGPTVRIEPSAGDYAAKIDSSATKLTQAWLIQVEVKDDRTSVDGSSGLLPTKWAILRALSQQLLSTSTLRALTFNSKKYVMDCRLREHKDDYSSSGKPPGKWRTAWRFEVDMVFTTGDLAPA